MDLSWEKWLVMGALAVISIALGLIPLFIFRSSRRDNIFPEVTRQRSFSKRRFLPGVSSKIVLTILSCFGGGVLLATAVVHMLTEARDDLAHIPEIWTVVATDFPLAEVLTLVGFLLIYFVEEIAHFIMADESHNHHAVLRHNSIAHSVTLSPIEAESRKISRISSSTIIIENCNNNNNNNIINGLGIPRPSLNNKREHLSPTGPTTIAVLPPTIQSSSHDDDEASDDGSKPTGISSSLRSLLALIALSFHAIMEGIAIGIQDTTDVWFMFGAVASHKFVISFCMGMELHQSRAKTSVYLSSIIFFGVISPIGILIGSLISQSGESSTNSIPVAVIKALSTGTLLYVVFFEILNREKEKKAAGKFNSLRRVVGFIQILALVVGMVAMVTLVTLAGHSHAHDDDSHDEEVEDHTHSHHDHDDVIHGSHQSNHQLMLRKLVSKTHILVTT